MPFLVWGSVRTQHGLLWLLQEETLIVRSISSFRMLVRMVPGQAASGNSRVTLAGRRLTVTQRLLFEMLSCVECQLWR